jgi:ATP-dependent exoDNAse (exonuclease V) beta subunit
VAVLKLIHKPNSSEQHKVIFDQLWNTSKHTNEEYHTSVCNFIHRSSSDFFKALNTEYGSSFKLQKALDYPLIQLVDYTVASFPYMDSNDPFVSTFLEDIFEFSRQRGASLINYLNHWETQSQKLTLSTPESLNAIKVMTIHQAKGLEFAVLILPFMDTPLIPNVREKVWYPFNESPLDSIKWGWINFSNKLPLYGKQAEALYNQQKIAKELDALNVLYVALTRAKNQLYLITQTTTETEQPKSYADLFGSFVRAQGIDLDATSFFEFGKVVPKKLTEEHSLKGEKILLEIGISDGWKNHLIAPKAPTEEVLIAQKKGLLIHELLSKITAKEMIDEVIEEEIKPEKASQAELIELKQTLNQIVDHPELKQFFDGTDKVLCEQEILIPQGLTLRPDRINISNEGKATILDYKTGQPKIEDKKQLETYVDALNQLGFQKVKSKLVYIDREIEVITIE